MKNTSSLGGATGYQAYQPYTVNGATPLPVNGLVYRNVGQKYYELKDHLGNVRVVVSDRKDLNTTDNSLAAHVVSYNNYYPFGMPQPNRNFDSQEYRYGFQGQEKDSELKGEGLSVNYKYRVYDTRVARFFSVDPLAAEYPWNSTYAFSENRVVDGIELEGREHSFYLLNYTEDGINIKLENVYTLDASIEDVFGNVHDLNISSSVNILDCDGSWHIVPDEFANQSLANLGDITDIMDYAVEWKNTDEVYEAGMIGEALQNIGQKAEVAVGVAMLASGIKNLKSLRSLKSASTATFLKNIKKGIKFENSYFSNLIKQGKNVTRRVSFKAKDVNGKWVRAVVDGVVKNADESIDFIETKLRASTNLSKNQKIVYKALKEGKAVAVGKNAEKAGFKIGQKVKKEVKRINKFDNE